jgi:hypothetical protein
LAATPKGCGAEGVLDGGIGAVAVLDAFVSVTDD